MRRPARALALMLSLAAAADARAGETACWFENGAIVAPAVIGDMAGDYIVDLSAPRTLLHETKAQMEGIVEPEPTLPVRLAGLKAPAVSVRVADLDARGAGFATPIAGVIGICFALMLSRFNITSFLDIAIEFAGLFGGAFGGAYTLGMFTRRSNWQGVLVGMGVAYVATFVVWWFHLLHPFLYIGFAILVSIVVGYVASFLFPAPAAESLRGLTIFTPEEPAAAKPAN